MNPLPTFLIDGNNLGHVLGCIDKAAGRYDYAALLSCLDAVAAYLTAQGQAADILLFLDDATAAERVGGRHVEVAPVPGGDADAAIRAYLASHADRAHILVSSDRALCGDASLWGAVCISSHDFVSHYVEPAQQAKGRTAVHPPCETAGRFDAPASSTTEPQHFQGAQDRACQAAMLDRVAAILRGEPVAAPEVYRLDLTRWSDEVELALYLSENHLCPAHADLTTPAEMIAAIRDHCCHQPRYFTAGRIIDRVFRLFLCRPEHTLTLDDLVRLSQTRRRKKVRAALQKYGGRLGIQVAWSIPLDKSGLLD